VPSGQNQVESTTSSTAVSDGVTDPDNSPISIGQPESGRSSEPKENSEESEIVASGTTAGEENTEEESSDQLPTEQGAEAGVSIEITDELLLFLLCCIALVVIAFAVRMLSHVKQK
jgi:hypothetical protein